MIHCLCLFGVYADTNCELSFLEEEDQEVLIEAMDDQTVTEDQIVIEAIDPLPGAHNFGLSSLVFLHPDLGKT